MGRILNAGEAATDTGFLIFHINAANTIAFSQSWNGTGVPGDPGGLNGQWSIPATDSQWNAVAVRYDTGSTANDPDVRVNFAGVSVTETSTPAGTVALPNTGICIGNRAGQDRTWDGGLMHIIIYSGLLSDANADKALRYPGSIVTNGLLWAPLRNSSDTTIYSVSGGAWVPSGSVLTMTSVSDFATGGPNCETV